MNNNRADFTIQELAVIFGKDKLINVIENSQLRGVSTDTRTIEAGNIFVALIGENHDAHEKVEEAFAKGASIAVVNSNFPERFPDIFHEKPLIICGDTLEALGKLASFHRNRFTIPVVAIGGSNGKTTTKNIAAHLLSQKYNVLSTYGNFNNRVGLPLNLLQMNEETEIAILEIGTNEPGEISILSEILKPTAGLITNIGKEHLEKLGSIRGVEIEETILYGYLHKSGGVCFVNIDDKILVSYLKILENTYTYGSSDLADLFAETQFDDNLRPEIKFKTKIAEFFASPNTNGFSTALNAIAAAAIAIYFKINPEEIKRGLDSYRQDTSKGYGRMTVEVVKDIKIINDCYNSNPDSLSLALKALKTIRAASKRIAVLADMLELGESSAIEHKTAIEMALKSADFVFLYGKEMQKQYEEMFPNRNNEFFAEDTLKHFKDKNILTEELLSIIETGCVVLVKGSRGMRLEEIVENLREL